MDIEQPIERLNMHLQSYASYSDSELAHTLEDAATALSTLQTENEKLRETVDKYATAARVIALHLKPFCDESLPYDEMIADAARKASDELEQVKAERGALIEDFVDYVTGGVPNPAIFCKNRCSKCVDMRGWCTGKNCNGFYPSGASGQKED